MRVFLNLREWAEQLRVKGTSRQVDFADEILKLIDLEDEVAEPYADLCEDLEYYAPDNLKDDPAKTVEWLGDRSALLDEVRDKLNKHGLTGDVDDEVRDLCEIMAAIEDMLEARGGWTEGDLLDALAALCERAERPAQQYDL